MVDIEFTVPLPPILVTPLYETAATVIVPDEGAATTTVPIAVARAFSELSIVVPVGWLNVSLSEPPALKKYLAASPFAKLAVKVATKLLFQVVRIYSHL